MRTVSFITIACSLTLVFGLITVRAGVSDDDNKPEFWNNDAQRQLHLILNNRQNTNIAKNVIIFLGDGMGIPTITAARILGGQKKQMRGEEHLLSFEKFPNVALIKTYNVDRQVPDSAATATAIFSGVKTNYEMLGVSPLTKTKDCDSSKGNEMSSILQWAQTEGKDTGIVTTTRLTHATPAALYCHAASRYWESDNKLPEDAKNCKDIARQLVEDEPGKNIKLLLGGGLHNFIPSDSANENGEVGLRKDGQNLINKWIKHKNDLNATSAYVKNTQELQNLDLYNTDYLLGIFSNNHMQYELERDTSVTGQPSLAQMTKTAVEFLQKSSKGFFLMVEGGRIDHAHHDNLARKALEDTLAFDQAIQQTLALVDQKDTLIVVTADHSHVMTINGYPERGRDILGVAGNSPIDHLPYTTLTYANGPSAINDTFAARQSLANTDTRNLNYTQMSMVPYDMETHGGEDVAVFALGPMAHLFQGVQEQNYIAHAMGYASCVGINKDHCNNSQNLKNSVFSLSFIMMLSQIYKSLFI